MKTCEKPSRAWSRNVSGSSLSNLARQEISLNKHGINLVIINDNDGVSCWARLSRTPVALASLVVFGNGRPGRARTNLAVSPRACCDGVGRRTGVRRSASARLFEYSRLCGDRIGGRAIVSSSTPHAPAPPRACGDRVWTRAARGVEGVAYAHGVDSAGLVFGRDSTRQGWHSAGTAFGRASIRPGSYAAGLAFGRARTRPG